MFPSGPFPSKPAKNIENTISDCTLSNYSFASNVYLRIKPNLEATNAEIYTAHNSTTLHVKKGESIDKKYTFTRIFDSRFSQEDFFHHSVRRQVFNFLLGESSTILTYGASNSGKTYTLYGTPESPGVIPRAIELLFSTVNCTLAPWYKVIDGNRIVTLNEDERAHEIQCKNDIINPEVIAKEEYTQARLSLNNSNPQLPEERDISGDECMSSVWISVGEIYNDYVYDLLVVNEEEKQPLKMASRKDGSTYVKDLKFIAITTAFEACQLLVYVQSKMTTASTVANAASSRSHTFFTIKLLKYERQDSPEEVHVSTLTFCDVAGSRRFKKRAEKGVRLTEWRNINNSLLVLGRCLKTARTSSSIGDVHVGPFRESKLTRILQKALTGREKISFIVTIDTETDAFAETLSILNFSATARKVNAESKVLKRNAFSIITPRSPKSSTIVQTPEKLITVDSEEYETLKQRIKELTEELEEMQFIYHEKKKTTTISRGTQPEKSFVDYEELEKKNVSLLKNIEDLEGDNLDRELEGMQFVYHEKKKTTMISRGTQPEKSFVDYEELEERNISLLKNTKDLQCDNLDRELEEMQFIYHEKKKNTSTSRGTQPEKSFVNSEELEKRNASLSKNIENLECDNLDQELQEMQFVYHEKKKNTSTSRGTQPEKSFVNSEELEKRNASLSKNIENVECDNLDQELQEMQFIYHEKKKNTSTISRGTQPEKSFINSEELEKRNASLSKNIENLECDNLDRELEEMQFIYHEKKKNTSTISRGTQPEKSFVDYEELEERNASLLKNIEDLQCNNLDRELELRQKLAEHYSSAVKELQSCWKERTQIVEEQGRELLKWSVDQMKAFYKERIDNIMYSKKRKRIDGDDGIQSICRELETENAMITSKVIALREMVRNLRAESQSLSAERNKCNFELVLIKERLTSFHDLLRIHFPELFVKIQDVTSDVDWLVHELKIMFDQKTRSVEILQQDLNKERNDYIKVVSKSLEMENELCNTKRLLQESLIKTSNLENELMQKANVICNLEIQLQKEEQAKLQQSEVDSKRLPKKRVYGLIEKHNLICSDDFFCNSDNSELRAHIDTKAERYLYSDSKNSPKKVSLNSLDTFRSSTSSDVKEDSGMDVSSRSQRSTSINDSAIMHETKEKWTQTLSLLETNNDTCENATGLEANYKNVKQKERSFDTDPSDSINDVKSVIIALRKVADANMSELAECKATLASSELRMEELEKENENLRKMIEVDSQKYKQRIKELSEELLIKEENETGNLKRLENCLEKCDSLEDQLSVLHLVHKQMARSFPKCIVEEVSQIEKLAMEPSSGKSSGVEIGDGTGEALGDLLKVQQLHEKVNELETVLEKCREEKSNYRERLREQLEAQSMLETKLKWLSKEICNKDGELTALKAKVSGVAVAQSSNDEEIKNLGEKIFRSYQTVHGMKEKLADFEEMRKYFEEVLKNDMRQSYNSVEKEVQDEGEFSRLKLELIENKCEMDAMKKHRNDMIKKYECMVQQLRTEVEKKKERMIKLQKLLLASFVSRCKKSSNKKCDMSMIPRLIRPKRRTGSFPRVDSNEFKRQSLSHNAVCSIVDSHYARPFNIETLTKNTESDANSVCKSEESCPTENGSGLNDYSNVDACQVQTDASDCSEERCGCGIGFKNARRQERMSGWMKVRRSSASTDLRHQLDGNYGVSLSNGAFKPETENYRSEFEENSSCPSSN